MKLITKELLAQFKSIGNQEGMQDPIIVAKFFNPCGAGTWYSIEFDEETGLFYGYVSIFGDHCDEWGCFSLKELESVRFAWGLGIERDICFSSVRFSELEIK